jgi:hypothetical protein
LSPVFVASHCRAVDVGGVVEGRQVLGQAVVEVVAGIGADELERRSDDAEAVRGRRNDDRFRSAVGRIS